LFFICFFSTKKQVYNPAFSACIGFSGKNWSNLTAERGEIWEDLIRIMHVYKKSRVNPGFLILLSG